MFLRDPLFWNSEVCKTPNVPFPIFRDIFEKLSIPQFVLFAMSDRYKYAKNGIYKCENFAQHVEQNRFPEIHIGLIGGMWRWHFKYTLKIENDQVFLYPSIFCDEKAEVKLCTFFNVLKKDGSSGSMRRKHTWILEFNVYTLLGKPFDVSELLNPENEYLDDDGSLSIEYGMHIDAIKDEHKIWNFNFHDINFNYTGEENQMVRCTHRLVLRNLLNFYCSPEILNFHCPHFVEQAEKTVTSGTYPEFFFGCLQVLHGVRLDNFDNFLGIARLFNLSNVIQYCDRPYNQHYGYRFKSISFCRVVKFNLRHILAEKLRCRNQKKIVEIAKKLDFTQATGEAMKTFVAKILYN